MLVFLTGCGRPDPSQRFVRPENVKGFGQLYNQNCRGCHGTDGQNGPAPPLNDPLFLAIAPAAELRRVIGEGRTGTLMPAFAQDQGGSLTAAQVDILAEGMAKKWGKDLAQDKLPAYQQSKDEPAGNAKAGAVVFAQACAGCHGTDGKHDKLPLNNPHFLALMSDQVLRRIVITGRGDFQMPDYRDSNGRAPQFKALSSKDIADVVALLVSWRKSPAKSRN